MTTHDERMHSSDTNCTARILGRGVGTASHAGCFVTRTKRRRLRRCFDRSSATRAETVMDDESSMTNVGSTRAETVPQNPEVQRSDDELLFASDTSGSALAVG